MVIHKEHKDHRHLEATRGHGAQAHEAGPGRELPRHSRPLRARKWKRSSLPRNPHNRAHGEPGEDHEPHGEARDEASKEARRPAHGEAHRRANGLRDSGRINEKS